MTTHTLRTPQYVADLTWDLLRLRSFSYVDYCSSDPDDGERLVEEKTCCLSSSLELYPVTSGHLVLQARFRFSRFPKGDEVRVPLENVTMIEAADYRTGRPVRWLRDHTGKLRRYIV